jgi:dihydrofolate synthase/folylpolyglutamate synthase
MLASILQQAGYKVGLYTSPHLIDFRERIKINGVEISEDFVVDFVDKHRLFFEQNQLSFFEMTVGLAFEYFKQKEVDIAIIEVGLGGRLDSTNVITPLLSVITTIGLDHTQFLGDTLAKIAYEKAGIIKKDVPVVIGEYSLETKPVFIGKSNQMQAPIYFASDLISETYPSDLLGDYQMQNKKTVLQTIRLVQSITDFTISEQEIQEGFLKVGANTGLMGRWQQLQQKPTVICDTAHNKQGLEIVLNQIQKQTFSRLFFVLGFVNDKDLDSVLPLFPKNATYFFAKPEIDRGLDAKLLCEKATAFGLNGMVYPSVNEAYEGVLQVANESDFIYIGGSTFVVAEILSFISCK